MKLFPGGLFAGMFLSVLGGSMAFAWLPEKPARRRPLARTAPTPEGSGSA
ncbi:hypothetical protein PUR59_04450 [Streptomyces sp. SP18ES09]|nr:hypothetical protein [Streptomyces sp. SP18ES09]MEE1814272.1 hypothetical protein [Streptomyces sp. SP18ES09]